MLRVDLIYHVNHCSPYSQLKKNRYVVLKITSRFLFPFQSFHVWIAPDSDSGRKFTKCDIHQSY